MEFFKPGITYDFFQYRWLCISVSIGLCVLSLLAVVYPGPKLGIDFKGGTEVEVEFTSTVTDGELRNAIESLGFGQPEVISVQGTPNRYILRLEQISSLSPEQLQSAKAALESSLGADSLIEFNASPGGDKLALRLDAAREPSEIESALSGTGLKLRGVSAHGRSEDFRYEVQLVGVGDKVVSGLQERFVDRAPDKPLRVEWVGPKAGRQLRQAAIKSFLYAVAFIMVYIAFRFDLRFAPGSALALMHDALITFGVYIVLRKEVTLGTVAALLTVVGFSINDTIVIYDRIRENMSRMRDATLVQVINLSTSQTLSRTVITSGVALISILGFFVWGTPLIRDIVFALAVGFTVGTYSSIYVAAPMTEWVDRRFFRKA